MGPAVKAIPNTPDGKPRQLSAKVAVPPVAETLPADSLDGLLTRMAGGATAKVQAVVNALAMLGLERGSQLLSLTETAPQRQELQDSVAEEAMQEGCPIPANFVATLRIVIQDGRLAFSGFPTPPPWTTTAVLFSAPHSLHLQREGHRPHIPEAYTSHLVRDFAQTVGGAFLTWSQREEARVKELYRSSGGQPDPTNQDPNFTHVDDVPASPWARNLREVRGLFGRDRRCLHVDLHGCKDPGSDGGSHLVVGLRAMEFAGRCDVEAFRMCLVAAMAVALRGVSVNVRPQKQLTGAWDNDRRTLTQQSLSAEGGEWTHAVQLEMSRCLRNRLARCRPLREMTASAILTAWTLCAASEERSEPDASWACVSVHVVEWLAQCRKFYDQQDGCALQALGGSPTSPDPEANEEDRGEGTGVTANNEVASASCNEAVEELEEALFARASALELRYREEVVEALFGSAHAATLESLERSNQAAKQSAAMPVAVFRDWLRHPLRPSLVELSPVKLAALTAAQALSPSSFFVAGTWNDFKLLEMRREGPRFVHSITIGRGGWESFQLLIGGNWDTAVYPSVQDANPFVEHRVEGPDNKGHGRNWTIGWPDPAKPGDDRNLSEPGARYRITVFLDAQQRAHHVSWERLGTGAGQGCRISGH